MHSFAARSQAKVLKGQPKAPKKTLAFGVIIKQPVFIFLTLLTFGYGAVEFGNANWFVSYAQNGLGFYRRTVEKLTGIFYRWHGD